MLLLRRIIFYFFLIVYLILCPALLLYSSGYIINPLTKEVERTGLIHLSSVPKGARIYLERSRFLKNTPATIDKLNPGDYRITLELPGYRLWRHTVSVEPGKAAVYDDILLLPQSLPIEQVLPGNFKQMTPLLGTDYMLLARDSSLGNHRLYNHKNNKWFPLVGPDSDFYSFPVISILHEEESKVFIVYGGSLWDRKYLFIEPKAESAVITDITKLFSQVPLLIQWDPLHVDNLFAFYSDSIDRLDVDSSAIYPKYLENVKGCGFRQNKVFYVADDNTLMKAGREKAKAEPYFSTPLFPKSELLKDIFYRILAPSDDYVLLWGEDGQLLSNLKPYELMAKGVGGLRLHPRSKDLMYWTRSEVKVARAAFDKESEQKGFLSSEIYSKGEDIRQCFWSIDQSHVVCNDNDKLFFIEIEPQNENHIEFLAQVKKGTLAYANEETGDIYFLDNDGVLRRIGLLSRENIVGHLLNKG